MLNRYHILIAIIPLVGITLAQHGPEIGKSAPYFNVTSGNDEPLTLDMTTGKVTVIIYLSKNAIGKNRELTNELLEFYESQEVSVKTGIIRAGIVNASDAIRLFIPIWKNRLMEQSKERGITIFGDWNGAMLCDFNLLDDESNVVIIDKCGIVRYYAFGKIESARIEEIKQILADLLI